MNLSEDYTQLPVWGWDGLVVAGSMLPVPRRKEGAMPVVIQAAACSLGWKTS